MPSTRPLSGITVIEIGHSIAAPYAGMILGELGAEVIKVENPKGGDAARGWGPPFAEGAATCFHAVNRAKKGVTIDLADPAEAEKLRRLVLDRADVLIHNLKFGRSTVTAFPPRRSSKRSRASSIARSARLARSGRCASGRATTP
jgi:crotonobetainyl-CoA:carnitine CoA-transferase CaiB-like acyl-CoA transferase